MRRVFLADDRPPVLSALRLLLEHQPDLAVVGEVAQADQVLAAVTAAHPDQVLAAVAAAHPDLILLDWHLVQRAGHGLVSALRRAGHASRIVALSCRPEDQVAARAAGADAFVCMGEPPEHLLGTVRAVLAG